MSKEKLEQKLQDVACVGRHGLPVSFEISLPAGDHRQSPVSAFLDGPDIARKLRSEYPDITLPELVPGVAFCSIGLESRDNGTLVRTDDLALQGAVRISGNSLLLYGRGELDEAKNCTSTCVWTDWEAAVRAAQAPEHLKAAKRKDEWYEKDSVEVKHYSLNTSTGEITERTRAKDNSENIGRVAIQ